LSLITKPEVNILYFNQLDEVNFPYLHIINLQ